LKKTLFNLRFFFQKIFLSYPNKKIKDFFVTQSKIGEEGLQKPTAYVRVRFFFQKIFLPLTEAYGFCEWPLA
jgi:hypothetical protein